MVAGFLLGGYMGLIYARLLSGMFFLLYGLRLAASLTDTPMWLPVRQSWRSFCAAIILYAFLLVMAPPDIGDASGATLFADLILRIAAGSGIYLAVHALIWLVTKRPDGIERILLEQVQSILAGRRVRTA
jgi:hypothetical protein